MRSAVELVHQLSFEINVNIFNIYVHKKYNM